MPKRKNLIHEKIRKAKPDDLILVQAKIPAYLLSDVRTFGDTSRIVKRALTLLHESQFMDALLTIIGLIIGEIEKLEMRREDGPELDEEHLILLEIYRDIYFRLKESRILKM